MLITIMLWMLGSPQWAMTSDQPPTATPATAGEWTPQRPEFEEMARRLLSGTNAIVGRGNLDELEARLASGSVPPEESRTIRRQIAQHHLRLGDVHRAISLLDETIAEMGGVDSPQMRRTPEILLERGLAHLRLAEIENCINRHNRDCCIFPLKDGGVHTLADPARNAKEDYLKYLSLTALRESPAILPAKYYHAAWMLNVACMALNEYPDGVPVMYRVVPAARSEGAGAEIGRFVDVAGSLGVDAFDHAGGVIADDFDGDGWIDIVTSTCALDGPMKAWRNRGDGSFEFVADRWRLDDQLGGLNICSVDYNNDGRLDIFVCRGAWMFTDGRMRKSLLRQNPDGTFLDVTRDAGLGGMVAPSQAAVWADFDNDGWLDLYVAHESRQETGKPDEVYPSYLFRSNGDGTFTDVAASAGVTNDRYGKGVAAGDYDDDGDMDLYVSNIGLNRLYRNEGGMRFVDVAPELGVTKPSKRSFTPWFFDYDNDGDLDLWVCAYEATVNDVVRS